MMDYTNTEDIMEKEDLRPYHFYLELFGEWVLCVYKAEGDRWERYMYMRSWDGVDFPPMTMAEQRRYLQRGGSIQSSRDMMIWYVKTELGGKPYNRFISNRKLKRVGL